MCVFGLNPLYCVPVCFAPVSDCHLPKFAKGFVRGIHPAGPPFDLEWDIPDGSGRYHVHYGVFHIASFVKDCLEALNREGRPERRRFVRVDFPVDLGELAWVCIMG